MIPGFRTFGGGASDDFVDLTDPNVKSKMPNSRQAQRNMASNWQASTKGEVALRAAQRAAKQPMRQAVVKGQMNADQMAEQLRQQKILEAAKAGQVQERRFARRQFIDARKQEIRAFGGKVRSAKDAVDYNIGQAVAIGERQQVSFSQEQEALQQMFGGGDKIWGVNNNPVTIHNDLNPSRRGDDGTASMFGWGNRGERSGLF